MKLPDSAARWLLLAAQVLILVVYAIGFLFLRKTTGGTLFLFSTIAPLLTVVSVVLLAGAGILEFRRRHSLFGVETYEPGTTIFREGDRADCAYFIRDGQVHVVQERGGVESLIATLGPGKHFGEMALLTNEPRNATVRAGTRTTVAVLGKSNFLNLLRALPSTEKDILTTVSDRVLSNLEEPVNAPAARPPA